jgi:hypothetical protein
MRRIVFQCVSQMERHPVDRVFCVILDPAMRYALSEQLKNEKAIKHLANVPEDCAYFFLAGPLMQSGGPDCISLPIQIDTFEEIRNLVLAMNHTLAAHDHSESVWFTLSERPDLTEYMARISKIKELRFNDDDDEVEIFH